MGLDGAARRERGGVEIQDHRTLLERLGQLEGEHVAAERGLGAEVGRGRADVEGGLGGGAGQQAAGEEQGARRFIGVSANRGPWAAWTSTGPGLTTVAASSAGIQPGGRRGRAREVSRGHPVHAARRARRHRRVAVPGRRMAARRRAADCPAAGPRDGWRGPRATHAARGAPGCPGPGRGAALAAAEPGAGLAAVELGADSAAGLAAVAIASDWAAGPVAASIALDSAVGPAARLRLPRLRLAGRLCLRRAGLLPRRLRSRRAAGTATIEIRPRAAGRRGARSTVRAIARSILRAASRTVSWAISWPISRPIALARAGARSRSRPAAARRMVHERLRRPPLVVVEELGAVAAGLAHEAALHVGGRMVWFVARGDLARVGPALDAGRAAVVADAAVVDIVVDHYRVVVDVGDAGDIHVGHGAVVEEAVVIPVTADVADADVAEAIVDAAIEADVRPQ